MLTFNPLPPRACLGGGGSKRVGCSLGASRLLASPPTLAKTMADLLTFPSGNSRSASWGGGAKHVETSILSRICGVLRCPCGGARQAWIPAPLRRGLHDPFGRFGDAACESLVRPRARPLRAGATWPDRGSGGSGRLGPGRAKTRPKAGAPRRAAPARGHAAWLPSLGARSAGGPSIRWWESGWAVGKPRQVPVIGGTAAVWGCAGSVDAPDGEVYPMVRRARVWPMGRRHPESRRWPGRS